MTLSNRAVPSDLYVQSADTADPLPIRYRVEAFVEDSDVTLDRKALDDAFAEHVRQ